MIKGGYKLDLIAMLYIHTDGSKHCIQAIKDGASVCCRKHQMIAIRLRYDSYGYTHSFLDPALQAAGKGPSAIQG